MKFNDTACYHLVTFEPVTPYGKVFEPVDIVEVTGSSPVSPTIFVYWTNRVDEGKTPFRTRFVFFFGGRCSKDGLPLLTHCQPIPFGNTFILEVVLRTHDNLPEAFARTSGKEEVMEFQERPF